MMIFDDKMGGWGWPYTDSQYQHYQLRRMNMAHIKDIPDGFGVFEVNK